MNWDAAGALGELIGAVAVVATLAFLAVQVRQSQRTQRDANAIARAAAVDKAFDQFAEHRRLLASDPEITRIWVTGCAGEELDGTDAERFRQLAVNYLVQFAIWEQRSAAVNLPRTAELAAGLLKEELDLYPGLRPIWNRLGSRQVVAATSPSSEASADSVSSPQAS
jgi:hypothetical protein